VAEVLNHPTEFEAAMLAEWLPGEYEALTSNPSATKK
jgi:hypothetical protein